VSLTFADPSLGLNPQALAILAALSQLHLHDVADWSDADHDYECEIRTGAWYNCRESGVSLVVRHACDTSKTRLIITFGEVKSADDIFVDSRVYVGALINPPTRWRCGQHRVNKAVERISKLVKEFLLARKFAIAFAEAEAQAPAKETR
jgi:hypothetical protein